MPRTSIALSNWGSAADVTSNKCWFRRKHILFGKLRPYFKKVGVAPVDGVCSSDIMSRKDIIEATVCDCLGSGNKDRKLVQKVNGFKVLFRVHAVPDAFSTAEAREMVGRPFLKDYTLIDTSGLQQQSTYGPVHIIAIHKTVSETQARSLLGHPDIILVNAPFDYYLTDRVQHVQVLLINNCRDSTSTRHAVQRRIEWIEQSGEDSNIAERAKRRKKIITQIAKQIEAV